MVCKEIIKEKKDQETRCNGNYPFEDVFEPFFIIIFKSWGHAEKKRKEKIALGFLFS